MFWLYLVIALIFLVMEAFQSRIPVMMRAYAADLAAPVLLVLEKPVRAVQAGLERLAGVSDIYLENQSLLDENERLRQWREAAMQLARENERLRQMMKVPGREVPPAATARVIGLGGGSFERSVLISAGSSDGVTRYQAVVDEAGVVGRVVQAGQWTSRVLLVTDLNSKIPVRVERTGDLAVAEGQNASFLRLRFLPKDSSVREGDRILTSGHGGVFPPGLPVARVSAISEDFITLEPISMLDKLEYVRVMAYQAVPEEDKNLLRDEGDR